MYKTRKRYSYRHWNIYLHGYLHAFNGSCPATGNVQVTVNPTPTITLTSGNVPQTVCLGNAISPITYSTTGATGVTLGGALPAGVTGSYNAGTGVYTISGTPTATGTFTYSVTPTGSCAGTGLTNQQIIVNQPVTVNAGPDQNVLCYIFPCYPGWYNIRWSYYWYMVWRCRNVYSK
jgi:hypothetical protein